MATISLPNKFICSVEFANRTEFPFEEFSQMFNISGGCFNDTDPPICSTSDGNSYCPCMIWS